MKSLRKSTMLALLRHLFGDLEQTMQALAPGGWERSPWYAMFHPSARQYYLEGLKDYEYSVERSKRLGEELNTRPPAPEEYENEPQHPCYPMDELRTLIGACVYTIVAEEGKVTGPGGQVWIMEKGRDSAGIIEQFIKQYRQSEREDFWYDHFYTAAPMLLSRADTTPVYELLFQRLRTLGFDWRFERSRESLDEFIEYFMRKKDALFSLPAMDVYDPQQALRLEMEAREKRERTYRLLMVFQEQWEEELKGLKSNPPPVVKAYQNVFGRIPAGF